MPKRNVLNPKNKPNHYGGVDIDTSSSYNPNVVTTYIPPTTTVTTSYPYNPVAYNPYVYKMPTGIDYLVKKSLLNPVPYYPDATVTVTDYDGISTVLSSEDEYGNIKNTIVTNNALWTNPYDPIITSWYPDYIHPMLSSYHDLNSDPKMKKKITKYYLSLVIDKWLKSDMIDLLAYLQADNTGVVDFIKNVSAYDESSVRRDNPINLDNKIRFLEKYIVTYDFIYKILLRYMKDNGVLWVNLPSHKSQIKRYIKKKIVKRIKDAIYNIHH